MSRTVPISFWNCVVMFWVFFKFYLYVVCNFKMRFCNNAQVSFTFHSCYRVPSFIHLYASNYNRKYFALYGPRLTYLPAPYRDIF